MVRSAILVRVSLANELRLVLACNGFCWPRVKLIVLTPFGQANSGAMFRLEKEAIRLEYIPMAHCGKQIQMKMGVLRKSAVVGI